MSRKTAAEGVGGVLTGGAWRSLESRGPGSDVQWATFFRCHGTSSQPREVPVLWWARRAAGTYLDGTLARFATPLGCLVAQAQRPVRYLRQSLVPPPGGDMRRYREGCAISTRYERLKLSCFAVDGG